MSQEKDSRYISAFLLTLSAAIGFFARDVLFDGLFQTMAKSVEPLGSSKLSIATTWLSLALLSALLSLAWAYCQWRFSANESKYLKAELLRINPSYVQDKEYSSGWNEAQ